MIQKTFDLIGQINLSAPAEAIPMLDGDTLEVNIIRDGQRNTLLNLMHFDLDDQGLRIPIEPIGIRITIERAAENREVEERPRKLKKVVGKRPRASAAKKP